MQNNLKGVVMDEAQKVPQGPIVRELQGIKAELEVIRMVLCFKAGLCEKKPVLEKLSKMPGFEKRKPTTPGFGG